MTWVYTHKEFTECQIDCCFWCEPLFRDLFISLPSWLFSSETQLGVAWSLASKYFRCSEYGLQVGFVSRCSVWNFRPWYSSLQRRVLGWRSRQALQCWWGWSPQTAHRCHRSYLKIEKKSTSEGMKTAATLHVHKWPNFKHLINNFIGPSSYYIVSGFKTWLIDDFNVIAPSAATDSVQFFS